MTAHDEGFVCSCHERAGLRIVEPVRYGEWSGRTPTAPGFSAQDVISAVRTS